MGKSQFALLLVRAVFSNESACLWFRLRGVAVSDLRRTLRHGLAHRTGVVSDEDGDRFYSRAFERLPPNTLLVLDDLPLLLGVEAAIDELVHLCLAATEAHLKIVGTSQRDPPRRLLERLPHHAAQRLAMPPFAMEDLRELLLLHGAAAQGCDAACEGAALGTNPRSSDAPSGWYSVSDHAQLVSRFRCAPRFGRRRVR